MVDKQFRIPISLRFVFYFSAHRTCYIVRAYNEVASRPTNLNEATSPPDQNLRARRLFIELKICSLIAILSLIAARSARTSISASI